MFHATQLFAAWDLVRRKSQAAGVDGITTDLYAGVAQEQIRMLQQRLRKEVYGASPARGFYLDKPSGGQRLIGISTVSDRIVQRYLLQHIYPKLEESFSENCYAYRPGYSIYGAVDRVMKFYQHQPNWVVKTDIHQFFDHLPWALVMGQLERLQIDEVMLRLIEQQLKAGIVLGGVRQRLNQGVLQGGILSGALANLYLSEFDRHCLDAGIELVRYGDDCVAVCGSWVQANRALGMMTDWLEDLSLKLSPEKTQILHGDEEFTFLGHRFVKGTVIVPQRLTGKTKEEKTRAGEGKKGGQRIGVPKVCSIDKTKYKVARSSSTDYYWRDGMTTLYVTDQGAYLRVQHQQFQVVHEQEVKCSVPVNRVSHVVLFGCCNVSHGAVSLALRTRIPILYLASNGRYFGRLETEGVAQIDYLMRQVACLQDEAFVVRQAQSVIMGKLHNSRILLLRLNRKRPSKTAEKAIADISKLIKQVQNSDSIETMLGYEGQGAHLYFQAYATLLKGKFEFEKRTRRPPTDPINSLLDLLLYKVD